VQLSGTGKLRSFGQATRAYFAWEKIGRDVCNFVKLTVAGLLADGAGARVNSRSGFSFLSNALALDSIATENPAPSQVSAGK
jgi:hypothetical protein